METCESAHAGDCPPALFPKAPGRPAATGLAIKLGVVHALVDAACAAAIYSEVAR